MYLTRWDTNSYYDSELEEPESNGNKGLLHTSQISRNGALSTDTV